jgi:hypothetical protein
MPSDVSSISSPYACSSLNIWRASFAQLFLVLERLLVARRRIVVANGEGLVEPLQKLRQCIGANSTAQRGKATAYFRMLTLEPVGELRSLGRPILEDAQLIARRGYGDESAIESIRSLG